MPSWPAGEAIVRDAPGAWSVAVYRGDGEALWERAAREPRVAASTIKLAVLVALFRAIDAGRLRLDETRAVAAADKVGGSGVLRALHDGLALTLADLAYLMIAISDNTASNLLIDAVGLARVNAAIRDLGLRGTALGRRFRGRAARAGEPENITTAADLARLLRAILAGRAAGADASARMLALLHEQQHRDRLARSLPPAVTYAGKGGTLPGLALDAGILFAPRGPLIVVALAADLPAPFAADEPMGRLALAALGEWGGLADDGATLAGGRAAG